MHFLSDEKLFTHYPRPGKGIQNKSARQRVYTFSTAFEHAFIKHDFPKTVQYRGTGYSQKEVDNNLKKDRDIMLGIVYENAFKEIDKELEKYIDDFDGYIGEFPNPSRHVYNNISGVFDYFFAPSSSYRCPYEKDLERQCQGLKDSTKARFFRRCLAGVISVILLILALILNPVLNALPQFTAFLRETPAACYVFLACLVVPLEIVGLLTPLHIMKKRFEYTRLYYKALAGVVIGLGVIGNLYPLIQIGLVNYFTIFFRWLLVLYLIFLVVFYIKDISKEYRLYQEALQKLGKTKANIVRLYEENIEKLHRYVRLRTLWYQYYKNDENAKIKWLSDIEERMQTYTKIYEEIKQENP